MTTETEARRLLRLAADTVDVRPGEPITAPVSRHGRWTVPLIAAATVIAAVAIGFAVVDRDASGPGPVEPVGGSLVPVVGWDATTARQALQKAGLVVETTVQPRCGVTPGRVASTAPTAGTPVVPGTVVTLGVTSSNIDGLCVDFESDAPLMELMDLVAADGPNKDRATFAQEVDVYLNGERTVLTGTEARTSQTWDQRSALGVFATELARLSVGGTWVADPGPLPVECRGIEPAHPHGPARQRFAIVSYRPVTGCAVLDVYRDGRSEPVPSPIDMIVVTTAASASPTATDSHARSVYIAQTFVNFAEGRSDTLPLADQVDLYVGNRWVKSLSAGDVQRPAFQVCLAGGYAERSCPYSAIDVIADDPDGFRAHHEAANCAEQIAPPLRPAQGRGTRSVFLNSRNPQMCMDVWSVELVYNVDTEIVAVNVLLGSP